MSSALDCDFSPSSPHLLPNGLFSPQNWISFELLALSRLSGFSTFKGGKMLIFQGFANSRIVREFPPFSFKVRIATLTRNQVIPNGTEGSNPSLSAKNKGYSVCYTLYFFVDKTARDSNPYNLLQDEVLSKEVYNRIVCGANSMANEVSRVPHSPPKKQDIAKAMSCFLHFRCV